MLNLYFQTTSGLSRLISVIKNDVMEVLGKKV